MIIEQTLNEAGLFAGHEIRTRSGQYVDVLNPTPEMIHIEDIAHALSFQPRFAGHLPRFYSVAQHCVHVAEWLMHYGTYHKIFLEGLLHDATEAYLIDVPSPIKGLLTEYKQIENNLNEVIAQRFGLITPYSLFVKQADNYMLRREWHEFVLREPVVQPLPLWYPETAKEQFLNMFDTLNTFK